MNWKRPSAGWLIGAYIGVLGIVGAQRERMWAGEPSLQEIVCQTDFVVDAVGGSRNTARATLTIEGNDSNAYDALGWNALVPAKKK